MHQGCLLSALLLAACGPGMPRCESRVMKRVSSTDEAIHAVLFLRSCSGALGQYWGNVSVVSEGDSALGDRGNVFVFRRRRPASTSRMSTGQVAMIWIARDTLEVTYGSQLEPMLRTAEIAVGDRRIAIKWTVGGS